MIENDAKQVSQFYSADKNTIKYLKDNIQILESDKNVNKNLL